MCVFYYSGEVLSDHKLCMKQLRDNPFLCETEGFELLGSCIETVPMSAHVAANLAKWWKTKFLNGYKQFTVVPTDCSDGRPSDTEELLGRHRHDYSSGGGGGGNEKDVSEDKSDATPQKPAPPPTTGRRQLNFEEFECDVSVGGGVDTKGQERQEFSFTLYDFDGHGKITKDDIAGLVTTIYDTLGNTIKVPHYGSKTIKVKLTVSPDPRAKKDANANDPPTTVNPSGNGVPPTNATPLKVKFKRDLNVTIRESRHPKRPHRRRRVPTKAEEKYANSCSSSCRSGASENNEECAADISEDEDEEEDDEDILVERMLGKEFASRGASAHERRHRRYQQRQPSGRCRANTAPLVFQQRHKKRSSSLQREELLQIIQANMEKNNLSFQTSRKQCGDRDVSGDHRHSHHRHRHKVSPHYEDSVAARVQLHYLTNPRGTCYLDLASLNACQKNVERCSHEEDCRYDKLLGAVVCASAKHASTNFHQQCCPRGGNGHHRSRSHDMADPFRYHVLDPDLGVPGNRHSYADGVSPYYGYPDSPRNRLKSNDDHRGGGGKLPHFVLGHTSSPHHLKHRNREEDQARAMAQVGRWLDQEFSSRLDHEAAELLNAKNAATAEGEKGTTTPGGSPSKGGVQKDNSPSSPGATSSAERHEHHHVHEHVHHHYHHYQETPVLV